MALDEVPQYYSSINMGQIEATNHRKIGPFGAAIIFVSTASWAAHVYPRSVTSALYSTQGLICITICVAFRIIDGVVFQVEGD